MTTRRYPLAAMFDGNRPGCRKDHGLCLAAKGITYCSRHQSNFWGIDIALRRGLEIHYSSSLAGNSYASIIQGLAAWLPPGQL